MVYRDTSSFTSNDLLSREVLYLKKRKISGRTKFICSHRIKSVGRCIWHVGVGNTEWVFTERARNRASARFWRKLQRGW